jgi:hypothetical protein
LHLKKAHFLQKPSFSSKKHYEMLKILNVLALLIVLLVNYLANALPLNGQLSAVVSNKYYNEFAPAGITFTIWGVIYSLAIALIVWQFAPKNPLKAEAVQRVGFWFVINCVLNASWLFLWHYEFLTLSIVVMIGILYSLVQLNLIENTFSSTNLPTKWLPQATFGIYLGWICVATIANITTWLVQVQWNKFGLSDTFWTGSVIGVGAVTAALLTVRFKNIFIGGAVIWAFIGIILRQNQLHGQFTAISWAAVTWGLAIITSLFYTKR